jgi:hypothetical protein
MINVRVLTEDVHKPGQAPYWVIVHNEVVNYVKATYQCTPEQYWVLASQRRVVFFENVMNSLEVMADKAGRKAPKIKTPLKWDLKGHKYASEVLSLTC